MRASVTNPVRQLAVILLLLCFTDALCTDIGLRASLIQEGNPLVRHLYEWNIAGYYAGKMILPFLLLLLLPYCSIRIWMKSLMIAAATAYALVNLYHLLWLTLALRTISFS